MRAIVFEMQGGIETLAVQDVPIPEIGPTEVLVRVRACGLNHLDLMMRSGTLPGKVATPHIAGSEVAGDIERVGEAVSSVRAGLAVVIAPYLFCGQCEFCLAGEETLCLRGDILGLNSRGGYAEYVAAPAESVLPIPEGVSHVEAAAVTLAALSAWHMLITRARIRAGETVLVLAGGSGVGSAAIQIAKLAGCRVIATASTEDKLDKARQLGADEVINYAGGEFLPEVRRLTGKRGVDVVVEHVGAATWDQSVNALARNGRLVTCGATTGRQAAINIWNVFAKQQTLIGSYGGTRAELRHVLDLVARGALKPVIHSTLPLEEAGRAQRILEDRAQFGKVLLTVT
ncbi:MAG TPA: zinc-binding dehydrogenase [Dehalococcoidia bacterium]|nr:zinc-binding dehydrogenase [Dehalococcoidia bacterium]